MHVHTFRPMLVETLSFKVITSKNMFTNMRLEHTAEAIVVPPLWEKNGGHGRVIASKRKTFITRRKVFMLLLVQTRSAEAGQQSPRATRSRRSRQKINPASCRARSVNGDDGLEDIMLNHALRGEKLPSVPYFSPKPGERSIFCHRREIVFFVVSFRRTSSQMCFCRMPGRRTPRIIDLRVNTMNLGWGGAPNERATFTFRFHDVACVVGQRLLRSRNLAASIQHSATLNPDRTAVCRIVFQLQKQKVINTYQVVRRES